MTTYAIFIFDRINLINNTPESGDIKNANEPERYVYYSLCDILSDASIDLLCTIFSRIKLYLTICQWLRALLTALNT